MRVRVLLVAALLAAGALTSSADPRPDPGEVYINVLWVESVPEEVRVDTARKYSLELFEPREGGGVYRLDDTSTANIRRIVQDPRIADTHGLDRSAFTVGRRDPATVARAVRESMPQLSALRDRFPRLWHFYDEKLSRAMTLRKLPLFVLSAGFLVLAWRVMRHGVPSSTWLRLPELSPQALGVFRIVFAGGLIWAVITAGSVPPGLPLDLQRTEDWFATWPLVRQLAAHPEAATWIHRGIVAGLLLFGAGIATRVVYPATVLLLTIHVLIALLHKSLHDWSMPLVALWLMLPVPWSAALSVDALWRARRGRGMRAWAPPGLALWVPAFTMSLAFLAAAYAKLDSSGFDWVTTGAVRYHFIEDARQAPGELGLRIARSDALSVAASAGAVITEAGFFLVLLFRSAWVRAAFGLAGLSLLTGFYLFQGVFWPAWFCLLLAFLPWEGIVRMFQPAAGVRSVLSPAHIPVSRALGAVFAMLVAVQASVSALRVEEEPFLSDYGMYSYTWPSREAFVDVLTGKIRRYRFMENGTVSDALERRIRALPGAHDTLDDVLDRLIKGEPIAPHRMQALQALAAAYERRYNQPLHYLEVGSEERGFDWDAGAFEPSTRLVRRGRLDLGSAALVQP